MGNRNSRPFWDTSQYDDKNYDIFRNQLVAYNQRERGKGDYWRMRIGVSGAKKQAEGDNNVWAFAINGRGDALFYTLIVVANSFRVPSKHPKSRRVLPVHQLRAVRTNFINPGRSLKPESVALKNWCATRTVKDV